MSEVRQAAPGMPALGEVEFAMLGRALGRGWADMRRAPLYAVVFAGVAALGA